MSGEPLLSLNGEIIEAVDARISPFDRGFLWGDGVYEVTPCFGGEFYRLEDHIDRLYRSLRYVRIDPEMTPQDMQSATERLLEANRERLTPNAMYRVGHWVTRGVDSESMAALAAGPATVMIFFRPVDTAAIARNHAQGVQLSITTTRRNPPACVETRAKVTSKMNQILAELDAAARGKLSTCHATSRRPPGASNSKVKLRLACSARRRRRAADRRRTAPARARADRGAAATHDAHAARSVARIIVGCPGASRLGEVNS